MHLNVFKQKVIQKEDINFSRCHNSNCSVVHDHICLISLYTNVISPLIDKIRGLLIYSQNPPFPLKGIHIHDGDDADHDDIRSHENGKVSFDETNAVVVVTAVVDLHYPLTHRRDEFGVSAQRMPC